MKLAQQGIIAAQGKQSDLTQVSYALVFEKRKASHTKKKKGY